MSREFEDKVRNFEEGWSDEVRKVHEEQEEPSRILDRNESGTSRINELTATALAMQSQAGQESATPVLNLSLDG